MPQADAYGPPIYPTFEQVQALLERWSREHPETMKLDVPGKSVQGRPVFVARLTDPAADEDAKEHALITGLHSGVERSGTTTILCLMEWLLSDNPAAKEILRRQVVVCIPMAHPDGYVTGNHGNVYNGWTLDGPVDPAKMPEAVVVQQVMDELQPEVHADVHGLSMDFGRYIMLENSGSSYSNLALRSYHREIIRQMDEAALAEGFPSDLQESDSERIFWGPELNAMGHKLWSGRPHAYAAIYCYNRYHTLISASEVGWERSGFLRHRRLLEIGNERWPSEFYSGYATRVILSNFYHMVTAYGQTAAARRRSRVELWNKQRQLTHGQIDPNVEGKLMYVCATTAAAADQWLKTATLDEFVGRLAEHTGFDAEAIQHFAAGWPAGQNGPNAMLALQGGGAKTEEATPIEHGLALRLRLFYGEAEVSNLRLNGHPIPPSETDGYASWVARGMTYVQVNIPPERLKTDDVFIVTCEYDPGVKRERWRGWQQ